MFNTSVRIDKIFVWDFQGLVNNLQKFQIGISFDENLLILSFHAGNDKLTLFGTMVNNDNETVFMDIALYKNTSYNKHYLFDIIFRIVTRNVRNCCMIPMKYLE